MRTIVLRSKSSTIYYVYTSSNPPRHSDFNLSPLPFSLWLNGCKKRLAAAVVAKNVEEKEEKSIASYLVLEEKRNKEDFLSRNFLLVF